MQKGLIIVYTGDGKGKTTAALGTALRASGHHMQVSMIQFVKSSTDSGEERSAKKLGPGFELVTTGKGFLNIPGQTAPLADHKKAAEGAFELARQRITSGYWDIVILDEINVAVDLGLIDRERLLEHLRNKPDKLHVILTGRNAHPDLIAIADIVTEMRSLKHPYDEGIAAQKGIDF